MIIPLATLFRRQRGRCFYCDGETFLPSGESGGRAWSDATREHLKRKADGGEDGDDNLVMACQYCNSHRGAVPADLYQEAMRALVACGRHPVNRAPIRAEVGR